MSLVPRIFFYNARVYPTFIFIFLPQPVFCRLNSISLRIAMYVIRKLLIVILMSQLCLVTLFYFRLVLAFPFCILLILLNCLGNAITLFILFYFKLFLTFLISVDNHWNFRYCYVWIALSIEFSKKIPKIFFILLSYFVGFFILLWLLKQL